MTDARFWELADTYETEEDLVHGGNKVPKKFYALALAEIIYYNKGRVPISLADFGLLTKGEVELDKYEAKANELSAEYKADKNAYKEKYKI